MEKKITFDIAKVVPKDLDGKAIPVNVAKTVGNMIYMKATTLEWDAVARKIHAGKKVELQKAELDLMERMLLSPEVPIFLMVKKPLKDYFNQLNKA